MKKINDYIVIFCTAGSKNEAKTIADKLLEHKLAACINMTAVKSCFTWQGKIDQAAEILLMIKSKAKLFKKAEKLIRQFHSYEVPEIIALPVVMGNQKYLDWIKDSTA